MKLIVMLLTFCVLTNAFAMGRRLPNPPSKVDNRAPKPVGVFNEYGVIFCREDISKAKERAQSSADFACRGKATRLSGWDIGICYPVQAPRDCRRLGNEEFCREGATQYYSSAAADFRCK